MSQIDISHLNPDHFFGCKTAMTMHVIDQEENVRVKVMKEIALENYMNSVSWSCQNSRCQMHDAELSVLDIFDSFEDAEEYQDGDEIECVECGDTTLTMHCEG